MKPRTLQQLRERRGQLVAELELIDAELYSAQVAKVMSEAYIPPSLPTVHFADECSESCHCQHQGNMREELMQLFPHLYDILDTLPADIPEEAPTLTVVK